MNTKRTSATKHYRRRWAIIVLCVLQRASWADATKDGLNGARYVIVRYDDYGPVTPYPRESTGVEVEARLFELFTRHNAMLVVGVVPFTIVDSCGPERNPALTTAGASWLSHPESPWVELLRRYVACGTVEPALHGYEHRRRTLPGHRPGEFRNQPYRWQYDALRLGRDVLAQAIDAPVQVFVPPWNAWDANTVLALNELGFEWLSPDLHHADVPECDVRVVPQCQADPRTVLELVRSGQELPGGTIVVLVTHPFDFEGEHGEAYFRDLEELLTFVEASPEWSCVGLSDLPKASADDWRQRFRRAVAWENIQDLLQDSWGPALLLGAGPVAYRPADWYSRHAWPWQVVVASTMLVSAAIGWLVSWMIARRVLRSRRLVCVVALLATAGLIVLVAGAIEIASGGYGIRGVRWQAIAIAAGSTLGFVCAVPIRIPRAGGDLKPSPGEVEVPIRRTVWRAVDERKNQG